MKRVLVIFTLMFSTSAFAEGFFGVGLGVAGYPSYVDKANTAALTGTGAGFWTSQSEQKPNLNFSLFGGNWVNDILGFELGYKYLGGVSGTAHLVGPGFNRTDDFKLSGSTFYGAMLWRPSSNSGFFAKAGMHSTSMTLKTGGVGNILTVGPKTLSVSSNGVAGGVGVDLRPMRIELNYFAGVKAPDLTYPTLSRSTATSLLELNLGILF